jgi:hypothetical protein
MFMSIKRLQPDTDEMILISWIKRLAALMKDTPADDWHSVAVCSDGCYAIEKCLIFSFPGQPARRKIRNRAETSDQ